MSTTASSIEAEKAVLGSFLSNPELLDSEAVLPRAQDFMGTQHREIFEAIMDLKARKETIDIITVSERLRSKGPHSFTQLVDLLTDAPISLNIYYHIQIIRNQATRVALMRQLHESLIRLNGQSCKISDEIETLEKTLRDVITDEKISGFIPANLAIEAALTELERRIALGSSITGVTSGFTELDEMTSGFQPSDLIIIGARPAMGKTAFALNLAMNACLAGKKVAVFSLEMGKEQLIFRVQSALAQVDASRFRKASEMDTHDLDRVVAASRIIAGLEKDFVIDETSSITLTDLRNRCRHHAKQNGLDLVVIDYLQLMKLGSKSTSREREVAEISMGLKSLAKELGIPIIALAQTNREMNKRTDKRPNMSDLRESGSIEADADMIMFLHREEYHNPTADNMGIAEVIVAKNRHGEIKSIKLAYQPQYVSFRNLVTDDGD